LLTLWVFLARFVLILSFLRFPQVHAETSGTALSNERDVMRFDAMGGLSSPLPGAGGSMSGLWTLFPADAVGGCLMSSMHSLDSQDAQITDQSFDFVYEHSIAIWSKFHALRLRFGSGFTRIHRTMDQMVAKSKDQEADRLKWAGNTLISVAWDAPIADLIWFRTALYTQKTFDSDTPQNFGLFAGISWGGQWFNIGD
jgi:hypothetical protein